MLDTKYPNIRKVKCTVYGTNSRLTRKMIHNLNLTADQRIILYHTSVCDLYSEKSFFFLSVFYIQTHQSALPNLNYHQLTDSLIDQQSMLLMNVHMVLIILTIKLTFKLTQRQICILHEQLKQLYVRFCCCYTANSSVTITTTRSSQETTFDGREKLHIEEQLNILVNMQICFQYRL